MPEYRPDMPNPPHYHDYIFQTCSPTTGSPWKYFLEPMVDSLNYLAANWNYTEYDFLELSGGGWTAVLLQAIDTRIRVAIQVGGSEPFDFHTSDGDGEQTGSYSGPNGDTQFYGPYNDLPRPYDVVGYRDLYILGASDGRRQV